MPHTLIAALLQGYKRGEWHKYALYERSKKVIQISLICSSNYHMTPSLLRTRPISIATLKGSLTRQPNVGCKQANVFHSPTIILEHDTS